MLTMYFKGLTSVSSCWCLVIGYFAVSPPNDMAHGSERGAL